MAAWLAAGSRLLSSAKLQGLAILQTPQSWGATPSLAPGKPEVARQMDRRGSEGLTVPQGRKVLPRLLRNIRLLTCFHPGRRLLRRAPTWKSRWSICQSPWCKSSHHVRFQTAHMTSLNGAGKSCAVACHSTVFAKCRDGRHKQPKAEMV